MSARISTRMALIAVMLTMFATASQASTFGTPAHRGMAEHPGDGVVLVLCNPNIRRCD